MKKACLVVSNYLKNNKIFADGAFRDNINYKYICLQATMKEAGFELSTQDINSEKTSDIVIYASDMPKNVPNAEESEKSFLIIWESEFVRPDNFDKTKHRHFRKVFTWHDSYIDQKKYLKINFSHRFPVTIDKNIDKKKNLFTLIAGNKKAPHTSENDLYSERVKAIRWFEKHRPEDFDLYGIGWDRFCFSGPRIIRLLNRFPSFSKMMMSLVGGHYPSYRGSVADKKTVMETYRFSICYENVRDVPGYITEKIFDSFFAGCVPVYLGANNILDYIPKGCFIDMREFRSYEELYGFISDLSDAQYLDYLNNIDAFLKSHQSAPFQAECFAERICAGILNNYDS